MNEDLAKEISKKNVDIEYYANLTIKDKNIHSDIVELTLNHQKVYYYGYNILDKATEINPKIFYKHWDKFVGLLKRKNTYHREIGIVILSNLIKVDKNDKFSEIINDYLKCLYDEKISNAVYTAECLKYIIKNKPEYREKIVSELLLHRKKTLYNEKHEALLEYGFLEIFEENYSELLNKNIISAFILEKKDSISSKTKKKSRELIKKYGLK